jgi:hypothetical protein
MMQKLFIPPFEYGRRKMIEIFENINGGIQISSDARPYFESVNDVEEADWILIPAFTSSLTCEAGQELVRTSSELAKKFGKQFSVFSNLDLIVNPRVIINIFPPEIPII